jgi:signal transduction histidine kinase
MEKAAQLQRLLARSRRLPGLIIALTLLVVAATVFLTTRAVRTRIREQIAGRDGEVLNAAVALLQQDEDATAFSPDGTLADPRDQLTLLFVTSRLKGVMGARLFDASGRFVESVPPEVRKAEVNPDDLVTLMGLRPISRFHPSVRPSTVFYPDPDAPGADRPIPLLEVDVPLHGRTDHRLLGVAQFLIEGQSIAAEFARLDRHLFLQGAGYFGAAGTILVMAFGWAFAWMRRTQRLLAERTTDLLQANQELALAAKTSAVGAVAAHLIHGLKSPLTGLQSFVSSFGTSDADGSEDHWRQAADSTRRMQAMISQIVNVLSEVEGSHQYELTLNDLAQIVGGRVAALTQETGVHFVSNVNGAAALSNRTANLAVLILVNLVQNALQATPKGRSVVLTLAGDDHRSVCEVRDEGPGVPDDVRKQLFSPCRSTKGGCGIGLAISKQLANHLGANLDLKSSTPEGCVFVLTLPAGNPAGVPGPAESPAGYRRSG